MKKLYLGLCVLLLLVSGSTVNASANDGQATKNVYGDSGYTNSFGDTAYYDCHIPYALTYKDIGGFAETQGTSTGVYSASPMSESILKSKATTAFMRENDCNSDVLKNCLMGKSKRPSSVTMSHDELGFCIAKDKNGAEYYISAFPEYFFNKEIRKEVGCKEGAEANLIDVILTDDTIIHFVRGDGIGYGHSNGTENTNQDSVNYGKSKLKLEQYKAIGHAQGGQTIEIWSNGTSPSEFKKKYNIGSGEGNVQIAYVRVYNATIADPPKRTVGDGVDSKGSSSLTVQGDGSLEGSGFITEYELTGMPSKLDLKGTQDEIEFRTRDNLGFNDSYSIALIGENLSIKDQATILDKARRFVVLLGLIVMSYASIIFIAMVLDRVNSFIDVSAVKLLTFNKVNYNPNCDEQEAKSNNYISTKRLITSIIIMFIVGCRIISGGIFSGLSKIVWWFTKKFFL